MKRLGSTLLMICVLTALLGLYGCSDDPVTPHEDTELTADDVAHQAGFIVYSMAELLPNVSSKAVPSIQTLAGFGGGYWKDGSHVWTTADEGEFLYWTPEGFSIDIAVYFDITAVAGLANGTGSLESGGLNATFSLTDVDVPAAGQYPDAGTVAVSSGGIAATVTFRGGPNAQVQIGVQTWDVDLTDGTIS